MYNEKLRKFPLKLDLQMFAADGDPDPNPPADPQDPPNDPPVPPKKLELTQEEFDAKIAERLARERKKYADYDDVKTKLAGFETAEEERKKAAMSEKERLEAEKSEAERKAQEAEDAGTKAIDRANQRIIRTEFRLLAKESGVRGDALDDAFTLADKSGINVDDDGNVAGLAEVIDALIKAKPFLAEPTKKEPRNIGGGSGGVDEKPEKTKEQLLAAAAEKARKTGRIEDRMAYADLKEELSK